METVRADLVIELNVTCPECSTTFDMISGTDLNEEGDLMHQTLDEDRWAIDADDRLECSPVCPHCSVEFEVKGVNW